MRRYEIRFDSVNSEAYTKPITVLVMEPDEIGPRTGAMLFTHGWGGNRFQYQQTMEYALEEHDLVCVSVEFRQSGYDFDPVTGQGAYRPYDASFYQVFDVLNGLRSVLSLRPSIDRSRLFHYGGSQGGHIALLSAVFAPRTFACVYTGSAATHMGESRTLNAGRAFAPHELAVRDAVELAPRIECPVFMEHGTADQTVPHREHAIPLEARLRASGKLGGVRYYEGGDHGLAPVTTRFDTFKETAPRFLNEMVSEQEDDFAAQRIVTIPCADRKLIIDWSRPTGDIGLFQWVDECAVSVKET
jgi:dienelactone hydrolase